MTLLKNCSFGIKQQSLAHLLIFSYSIFRYTNGEVKLWNVGEQYDCLFQPSNTSLIINEAIEDGTIPNKVTHMAVSPKFVVAAYRQGR